MSSRGLLAVFVLLFIGSPAAGAPPDALDSVVGSAQPRAEVDAIAPVREGARAMRDLLFGPRRF